MAHFHKWTRVSALLLIPVLFSGCTVTVEDGGYQQRPAIVDKLETTVPEETTFEEMDLVSLDNASGIIINGPADVFDAPEGTFVTTLEDGAKVTASERSLTWVHIQQGWIRSENFSMDSDIEVDSKGTAGYVNASEVNVRSGPGTDNGIVGKAMRNDLLLITEVKEDDSKLKWGKFDGGWICLDYVTTDMFGVNALVLKDKTTVMGLAGEGGIITELNYGERITIRATEIVEDVIWGKIGDGWIDLSNAALDSYDSAKLHGMWRSYNSYNSWNFHTDGTFVYTEEDYEFKNDALVQKGNSKSYEGAFIYDGQKLHLYYCTVDGQKTASSVNQVSINAYMSGSDWIFKNETDNALIKDLTPQKIYEEKFAPKSDPVAVAWISGSWLYFTSHTEGENGGRTASGNLLTFRADGTFTIQSCSFSATLSEEGQLIWTATLGGENSGTYIYDGNDMIMTGNTTATVTMPKVGSDQIHASGLSQLGSMDSQLSQTMYRVSGADTAALAEKAATVFG